MSLYVLLVIFGPSLQCTVHKNDGQYDERPSLHVSVHTLGFAKWTRILNFVQKFAQKKNLFPRENFLMFNQFGTYSSKLFEIQK